MTAAEKDAWVKSITDRMERGPAGSHQNRFVWTAEVNLLNAIGQNSDFRGQTIAEVLDASVAEMKVPGFEPKYDPLLRALDWPEQA